MPTVKLANFTQFKCLSEQTLLDAARLQGITLEHSCRTGRCGVCKAYVLSGETVALKPEEYLDGKDQAEGLILTCCRTASTDIQLDIEDLGELGSLQIKTLPCRIDSLQLLSADVIEVTLRTPPNSRLEYLPGQYVDIIGKDSVRRSYSIANAPRDDGKITLQVRKVESGQMSRYWFEEAKANDLLRLEGPLGTFCLRNTAVNHLVFLATGTGIAPVKAMLEQLAATPERVAGKTLHVYWGGRVESDIYWQPHFENLHVNFTSILSRADPGYSGRAGYVQQALLDDKITLGSAVVYACGSEQMISSAREKLNAAGLPVKNFHSDAFVSSN